MKNVTELKFKLVSGSMNDNAVKLFKAVGLPFRYSQRENLEVYYNDSWHAVRFTPLGNDEYEVIV